MYKAYYGMATDPFNKEIPVKECFKSANYTECIARLKYVLQTKGIASITGHPGSGKSFALRSFIDTLNPNLYKIIYMPLMNLTTFEFLKQLAHCLKVPIVYSKIDLVENIKKQLKTLKEGLKITPIIIIDEAHQIKSSMLEELKVLLNFNLDSKEVCILVLAGHPSLNNILSKHENESFMQRIVINYRFEDISVVEVENYISTRLEIAKVNSKLFNNQAINALSGICNNSYRVLNNLIVKCLIEGSILKKSEIDAEIVYRAKQDLDLK